MPALPLSEREVRRWIAGSVPLDDFRDQRLLLVIPDSAPTAPFALLFDALFGHLRPVVSAFDVLVALGANLPMSESQIGNLLGISPEERSRLFFQTQFINHESDNPEELVTLGTLAIPQVAMSSEGRLPGEAPVQVNRHLLNYDRLLTIGPVPGNAVGSDSVGIEALIPGAAGPALIELMQELGELAEGDNPGIGRSLLRDVIHRVAGMIPVERRAVRYHLADGSSDQMQELFFETSRPRDKT